MYIAQTSWSSFNVIFIHAHTQCKYILNEHLPKNAYVLHSQTDILCQKRRKINFFVHKTILIVTNCVEYKLNARHLI